VTLGTTAIRTGGRLREDKCRGDEHGTADGEFEVAELDREEVGEELADHEEERAKPGPGEPDLAVVDPGEHPADDRQTEGQAGPEDDLAGHRAAPGAVTAAH
jgi:hypothetical protein